MDDSALTWADWTVRTTAPAVLRHLGRESYAVTLRAQSPIAERGTVNKVSKVFAGISSAPAQDFGPATPEVWAVLVHTTLGELQDALPGPTACLLERMRHDAARLANFTEMLDVPGEFTAVAREELERPPQ
jgi:hypothetical protein